jgi:hypothetical protein
MFLFVANPWTEKFYLHRYMMVNPMMFFFVALAVWALVRRNRWLFFAACAVGALNKEVLVPMVVAYPLSELLIDHRLRRSSVGAALGIVIGYSLFRVAMPENPGYSIFNLLWPGVGAFRLMALAGIDTFGLVLPAALWRPWRSRLMVALAPFAVACVLEAWFVDNLERAMVAAFPVVCVAIFWLWPAGVLRQVLTLLVVPLYFLRVIIGHVLGGIAYTTPLLLLVAVAAEVWLWSLERDPGHRLSLGHLRLAQHAQK